MDYKNWIIEWFNKNSHIEKDVIKNNITENYLEKGWVDSLNFITFINDIENEFNIRFSNDEFQNRKFSTITGLTEIIEVKINGKI